MADDYINQKFTETEEENEISLMEVHVTIKVLLKKITMTLGNYETALKDYNSSVDYYEKIVEKRQVDKLIKVCSELYDNVGELSKIIINNLGIDAARELRAINKVNNKNIIENKENAIEDKKDWLELDEGERENIIEEFFEAIQRYKHNMITLRFQIAQRYTRYKKEYKNFPNKIDSIDKLYEETAQTTISFEELDKVQKENLIYALNKNKERVFINKTVLNRFITDLYSRYRLKKPTQIIEDFAKIKMDEIDDRNKRLGREANTVAKEDVI